MAQGFPHLTAPGQIGTMQLRNRMVVTAMGAWLAEDDGRVGERQIAYHRAQAEGGAALIITGAASIAYPEGAVNERQIALSDDRYIPGLAALATAVHASGAKLAFQLHRAGWQSALDISHGRPLLVPSTPEPEKIPAMPFTAAEFALVASAPRPPITFREMTPDDMERLVGQYADAARRARDAGADGLELHVAHGYVLGSFLSPAANRRTDCYGGPIENRARLALEVLAAIRAVVGRDYPLWVKLDSREVGQAGGISIEDAIAAAKLFERGGANAITVSAYNASTRLKLHTQSHTPHEPALNLPYAARIRAEIGIPVIASGRIEPDVAEAAIATGQMDFLAMGRKILADPSLPNKIRDDRASDIRPCVYCYTCISASYLAQDIKCAVRPETGHDHFPSPSPVQIPRHILVIGGGPSGMEAARRLDALGHRVTLVEQTTRLGGKLQAAAAINPATGRLLDWLVRQIDNGRVELRLNTCANTILLHDLQPDHVIVATGSVQTPVPIPGSDQAHVLHADLLAKAIQTKAPLPSGDRLVIIGGDVAGLGLAEFFSARGHRIAVIDDVPQLGAGIPLVRRMRVLDDLGEAGVILEQQASDIIITAAAVTFTNGQGQSVSLAADHVIIAKGNQGNQNLAFDLKALGFDVRTSGDCNGVGYIEGAMRQAAQSVAELLAEIEN